ncbi:MAG: hypothetical protein HRU28_11065 [Rhizobiales bacterium]|nr:hypothetical protein [Hyphomicrobiales bacterium]
MKTYINQFKITAAGILSIAVLSSVMVVATVSTSSAKKIEHISENELEGKCTRSKGRFSGSKGSGIYSCVVDHADGSHTDVSCDDSRCDGVIYKKDKGVGRSTKTDLHSRTTLGKKDPISQTLRNSKKKSGSFIRK